MRLRIGGTADRHPGPTIPPATQVTWPPLLAQQSPWNPINQLRNALTPQPSAEGGRTAKIPLASSLAPGSVEVAVEQGLVSIVARNAPLDEILGILAQRQRLNLIAGENVTARISITLESVPLDEALTHVCAVAGYTWTRQGNVLLVTSVSASDQTAPAAQGREVRVFTLDYVAAADVDTVIRGLLSPVGQSFPNEMEQSNKLKTQEAVVVEDLPAYLDRIGRYVQQIDIPPRQVLIEAHVMKIELEDEALHGVNLTYLDTVIPKVTIETSGFAKASDPQAFFFSLTASSLRALLEALETTTDAKTLASPKVFAVNGQEARIQIGEQLGYRVTTTTQTSSLESVDFLDVGVVLTVTPQISRDGQVLMHVKPEVSSGKIDQVTELPEEETTEVQTTVLLPDGHGIVIGGLIQEKDLETQIKVPIVGDLWLIGRLFQKREVSRKRSEIVIAVIPHVVPYSPAIQQRECDQFHQASTPLLHGPLRSTPRPFEPRFPDAGQRLPLISKTNRFCPPPDPGSWAPQVSPGACLPGAQPVEGEYYGPVPIHPGEMLLGPGQQPAIDHSGPQEQMELLPAPLPAALPATGG
ncbi:MAG: hypothetical protein JXB62_23485 [Pirellulales bacterium]|nr:hypothetical protein [Pirellulales bacterium]